SGEEASLLNYFIDISDVRKFMQEYYKKQNLQAPAESVPAAEVARDLESLKRALREHSASRRAWACDQLASLGPEAKNAVSDLIEMLQQEKDDNARIKATKALSEIGSLSQTDLDKIIELMKDPKLPDLRLQAILVIRHMGEEADKAVPGLIERLKDDSPDVRLEATKTLGNLGTLAKSAVPALAELLQRRDKKHEVREEAALAI